MADARDVVLGRIRAALADRPTAAPVPRDYDTSRDVQDVVGLFAERAADYRAVVRRVRPRELAEEIDVSLRARGARRMAAPDDLPAWWRIGEVVWSLDEPGHPLSIRALDRSDGVLTGCAVAIAETGTVVLDAGEAQGRRALTLLPDYHLCVVRADQVVGTVPEALARLSPTSPLTFISGPSATSDIELDRVEGVHGPRNLEILIVN
ncbi:LutC/YkgG family protein [Actinophytocola gossypii]|uniref:LUD domain-containing protein n=1 Tax=Actinophytocola gossypii TaxID=2812003 RepID=A0ABT2JKB5_9PSEU|nr:LUD domain-containing protein [Actinophytocola gossypii]MCT2588226.1 LUD domain-containing protein [Actinophytocola gossypii]